MKRILALVLCLALLATLPLGCKKDKKTEKQEEVKVAELTDSLIGADLMHNSNLYYYEHMGTVNRNTGAKIVEKTEKDGVATLSVTCKVFSDNLEINLAANMTYRLVDHAWVVASIDITDKVATPIDAPDHTSVQMAICNYLENNPDSREQNKTIALTVKDGEYQQMEVKTTDMTWELKYDAESKTAKMHVSQKGDKPAYSGYYNISFDAESGWVIESEKQDNGYYYYLLHLDAADEK